MKGLLLMSKSRAKMTRERQFVCCSQKNCPQIRQIHNVYCINFLNLREMTKARDWNINSLFPSSRSMLARLDPNPDGLIHAAIHKLSNVSNRGKSSRICQNQPFIRCQRKGSVLQLASLIFFL